MSIPTRRLYLIGAFAVVAGLVGAVSAPRLLQSQGAAAQSGAFRLGGTTIAEFHRAIQQAQTPCRDLVRAYIDRARAYNGVSDRLVTVDGARIPPSRGTVRAGSPLRFPTETVAVSTLLPDYGQYGGPPIELGRMEATASDPDVQQQY